MPCPFQEERKDKIQDPEAPHAFTFCGRAAYSAYILTSSALRCVSVGVSMRASSSLVSRSEYASGPSLASGAAAPRSARAQAGRSSRAACTPGTPRRRPPRPPVCETIDFPITTRRRAVRHPPGVVHLSAWHSDPLSYLYHLLIGCHERSSKLPHSSMRVASKASHNNTGHHGLGSFPTRTFGLPRASPASNMPFRTRAHPSLPHVHAPCPHT
jgi:hypothetical protein